MHAAEVVVHHVEGEGSRMIVNFLAESVCQPGKSTDSDSDTKIRAVHERRRVAIYYYIRIPCKRFSLKNVLEK